MRCLTIQNSEIDRLGLVTHIFGDVFERHAKYLAGGKCMNINIAVKGLDHVRVVRQNGGKPKLELQPYHQFTMAEWEPDQLIRGPTWDAYLWIVPANVQGSWKLTIAGGPSYDLSIDQRFQKIEGQVQFGALQGGLRDAHLNGAAIEFAFVDQSGVRRSFSGRVNGAAMEGSLRSEGGPEARWSAVRR